MPKSSANVIGSKVVLSTFLFLALLFFPGCLSTSQNQPISGLATLSETDEELPPKINIADENKAINESKLDGLSQNELFLDINKAGSQDPLPITSPKTQPPKTLEIISFYPEKKFSVKEGNTIVFTIEVSASEDENIQYSWKLDRKIRGEKSNKYDLKAGYETSGEHEVEVTVSAGDSKLSFGWFFNIENVPCMIPADGMEIEKDLIFCKDTYVFPNGIRIIKDGVKINCGGATFDGNRSSAPGIKIAGSSNIYVENCNTAGFDIGLYISDSNNVIVTNGSFVNGGTGINLNNTGKITLTKNNVSLNSTGILIQNSSSNSITENFISENVNNGVYISSSNKNTISNNKIASTRGPAIFLHNSTENNLSNNIFENNQSKIDGAIGNNIIVEPGFNYTFD